MKYLGDSGISSEIEGDFGQQGFKNHLEERQCDSQRIHYKGCFVQKQALAIRDLQPEGKCQINFVCMA